MGRRVRRFGAGQKRIGTAGTRREQILNSQLCVREDHVHTQLCRWRAGLLTAGVLADHELAALVVDKDAEAEGQGGQPVTKEKRVHIESRACSRRVGKHGRQSGLEDDGKRQLVVPAEAAMGRANSGQTVNWSVTELEQ